LGLYLIYFVYRDETPRGLRVQYKENELPNKIIKIKWDFCQPSPKQRRRDRALRRKLFYFFFFFLHFPFLPATAVRTMHVTTRFFFLIYFGKINRLIIYLFVLTRSRTLSPSAYPGTYTVYISFTAYNTC
jgi:uncharacterized membrane protein YdjX (TVP38/TMEM64 family)